MRECIDYLKNKQTIKPPLNQNDCDIFVAQPAQTPTMKRATMMISKDLASSLKPIITAGTMEKMLLKSRVPFLRRSGGTHFKSIWKRQTSVRLSGKHYLPRLLTSGATVSEPKKPPSGYMDTESDHSRVRKLPSIGLP